MIDEIIMQVVITSFRTGVLAGMIAFLISLAIVAVLNIVRKFY